VAITAANKIAEKKTSSGTSFTTAASLTPSVNKLYICTVANTISSGTATTPTVSGGGGLTWVQIDVIDPSSTTKKTTMFRAMKSSGLTSGTITADFGGVTQSQVAISVEEFSGVDQTGTNGSGAIVQSAHASSASGTTATVTLAAFGDAANNAPFMASGTVGAVAITPESGYTELSDQQLGNHSLETEWKVGQDTSVTSTWTGSNNWCAIAVEIKAGGTLFTQAMTATAVVVTATFVKQVNKPMTATSVVVTGTMAKQVGKILAASSVVTATIIKQVNKKLTATAVAVTGSLLAMKVKTVIMTATAVVVSATMKRSVGKNMSASSVVTASITKRVAKAMTATPVAVTASMVAAKLKLLTMSATVAVTASMQKRVGKTMASTPVVVTGQIGKGFFKTLAATVTTVASMVAKKIQIPGLRCITPGTLPLAATGVGVISASCISPGVIVLVCITPSGLTLVCVTPGSIPLSQTEILHG